MGIYSTSRQEKSGRCVTRIVISNTRIHLRPETRATPVCSLSILQILEDMHDIIKVLVTLKKWPMVSLE